MKGGIVMSKTCQKAPAMNPVCGLSKEQMMAIEQDCLEKMGQDSARREANLHRALNEALKGGH